jgi:outer membrane protein assembly factor BamE (lipoprotein component of BamABCDE complex)
MASEIDMAPDNSRVLLSTPVRRLAAAAALAGIAASLGGCLGYDGVINRGAVVDERKAQQVKVGIPAPQVLALLGTPSTTSTVGGDAWYYFSQRIERPLAFLPQQVADQRILAVYFDKSKKVQRIADYGLEDGKPIDFLTRTTPTAGAEFNFIRNMLSKVLTF